MKKKLMSKRCTAQFEIRNEKTDELYGTEIVKIGYIGYDGEVDKEQAVEDMKEKALEQFEARLKAEYTLGSCRIEVEK